MLAPDRHSEIGRTVLTLTNAPAVQSRFAEAAKEAKTALAADSNKLAASVALALDLFGPDLPAELKSCRLSVMRAETAYHIERHPNATQYVLSIDGVGTIRVKSGLDWTVSHLSSSSTDPLTARWHSVPANTWHQPTPGDRDWTVVAFHTVPAAKLQDEYGYRE